MTTQNVAFAEGYWNSLGHSLGAIACYAIIGLGLMIVGFYAIDLTTPGKLRDLVREARPNAVVALASGMVSMSFIVVLAIWASAGKLAEGLVAATVYGLIGIVAQVIAVRAIEFVSGVHMNTLMHSEKFSPEALVVAAAHLGLGLVVAVAII